MTDHTGVLMMQRALLAGTLGLAMARKAAAILEGETGQAAPLLLVPQETATVLSTLLLEKASYELLYELNNRPTWLVIPLTGLLAIARNGA